MTEEYDVPVLVKMVEPAPAKPQPVPPPPPPRPPETDSAARTRERPRGDDPRAQRLPEARATVDGRVAL